jgi:hypothetical protein
MGKSGFTPNSFPELDQKSMAQPMQRCHAGKWMVVQKWTFPGEYLAVK